MPHARCSGGAGCDGVGRISGA